MAWWHTTHPERRRQWREDITRTNDPAVAALEGLAILDKFAAGEATAKDVSDLFAKTPRGSLGGSGATAIETLALGATIPGWHGDPFQGYWLDDWAIEGVPGAAAALCRVSVTSVNVIPETLHYCRHLAKRGDGDAAYRLGLLYHRRADDFAAGLVPMLNREVGFRADLPIAIRFFRQAARAGHAGGQARLAHLTAIGRGVRRDDAEALRLAQESAAQCNPEGMAVLGLLTLQGRGRPADIETGVALIRKAAERGNRMAQYTLSTLLIRGKVVAPDWPEGLTWLHLLHLDQPNDRRGDPAPEEYGNLMIEAWPRTTRVGNYYRMVPDAYLDAQARAIALRKRLAAEGLWPY